MESLTTHQSITEKDVNDRRRCEAILKHNLKMTASLSNGEWFRIDKDVALEIFNAIDSN